MVPRFFTRLKSIFTRRRASGLELVVPSTESEVFVDGPPYVHDASHSPTLGESQLHSHTEDVAEPMAHGLHAFFNPTTMVCRSVQRLRASFVTSFSFRILLVLYWGRTPLNHHCRSKIPLYGLFLPRRVVLSTTHPVFLVGRVANSETRSLGSC